MNEENAEENKADEENLSSMQAKLGASMLKNRISLMAENEGFKTETRKYFRAYKIEFGNKLDDYDKESIVFETYIVVDDKVKKKDEKK